jgi:hypothetical protein
MALADEADKRRRQVLAAATLADEQLCRGDNERSPSTTAAIVAAERVGREVADLAGNVADMSRHVGDDTTCRSNFGPMSPCCRHKI